MRLLEKRGVIASLPLLTLALWACDIPTESPQWEQRWIVPGDETAVAVEEILPDVITLTPDRSAFTVQVDPIAFTGTVEELCAPCVPLDGQLVPKPPFDESFTELISLPDEVESAQVAESRVTVQAINGFNFDPIRPPGGAPGSITLSLRDQDANGPVLDEIVVDGTVDSFAAGSALIRSLEYSGAIGSSLAVTIQVTSPAGGTNGGDLIRIDLTDQISVTATVQVLRASSAVVSFGGEDFELTPTLLDVADLDAELVERVQSGAFELEITNPWEVGAAVLLTIDGPSLSQPILKSFTVPSGPTSTVRVEFSQEELQSFLGQGGVVLTGTGTVDTNAGPAMVAPGQEMVIDSKMDLVILMG